MNENKKKEIIKVEKEKKCFIIMPIADMDGYDSKHFNRVYNHLIKPACEDAGFTPIRADDIASSNYIIIDILEKILDSDIVICDLSGRNPNVMYELGIRQAFDRPTVLIKDTKTSNIFDIQGLRYTEYEQSLRVDTVEKEIKKISAAIKATHDNVGKEVNSIIKLLGITPAEITSNVKLSSETSLLLSAIHNISDRLTSLEDIKQKNINDFFYADMQSNKNKGYIINGELFGIGDTIFLHKEKSVKEGKIIDFVEKGVIIDFKGGDITLINKNQKEYFDLSSIPF